MPLGDRTGPMGQGPMTGRRMGSCTGYNATGYSNCGFGRGFGRGFKRRAFWAYNESPVQSQEYQKPSKEEILNNLKAEKEEIDKAIKELEKKE